MQLSFTPQNVALKNFDANLGKSDIKANGTIDNILAYFSPEKTMTGKLKVRSAYFDANEWNTTTTEETPNQDIPEAEPTAEGETEIFDRFDFTLDAELDKIEYENYELANTVAKGHFTPEKLIIESLGTKIGNSDIQTSGVINNVFGYVFDGETLTGDLNLRSKVMDLNQFMTDETVAATSTEPVPAEQATEPVLIPENIKMRINTNIGRVYYTNMTINQLTGALVIEDQAVVLDNVTGNTLGGKIGLSGGYDTKNAEEPEFDIKFNMSSMNFQKVFTTFNTFQRIAPIGEFVNGTFNTDLIMNGKLGKDLMPKLNTLTAQGFLHTLNAVVSRYKPFQAVGNSLRIKELKDDINIENTKNWFEIKDGYVDVKEFDTKVSDIDMKIAGRHSLENTMDYNIKAKVPVKMIDESALGDVANTGFKAIQDQASKLGLDIKKSEFINVKINLTGSAQDPKVKFNVLGGDGEASVKDAATEKVKEELDKKKEELREEAEKKVDEAKAKAEKEVDKAKEKVQKEVDKKVEEAKEEVKEKVEQAVDEKTEEAVDQAKEKAEEALGDKAKEGADKIKDELDKWNPFGKKKKKDGN